ncbi:MAG: DUF881 domain-containing protein [Actinomycetota bacterium]
MPRRHIGLGLVLMLFGLLVSTGYLQERLREERSPIEQRELLGLVERRRAALENLSRDVARLSGRLERVQERVAENSQRVEEAIGRVEGLRAASGFEALTGPGVIVELTDSEREARTREDLSDLRIQHTDLQLVVNALWQAGAEAVALNGNRIVATTAIRTAGTTILVNYRGVGSPYRVVAIGDTEQLAGRLAESPIAKQFEVWHDVYGLGFEVVELDELFIPPLRSGGVLRYARPHGALR